MMLTPKSFTQPIFFKSLRRAATGLACAGLLTVSAASCGEDAVAPLDSAAALSAAETYATIVHANYEDSTAKVVELNQSIEAFLADPTEANLAAARAKWIVARPSYLQTEVFRFYDGPIDGMDGDPEGLINAWPMDEFSVDYVEGMPMAGRINDDSFTITPDNLAEANGEGGEADVATGWHAIEFLLWGQDLTAPDMNMPGQRAATDYTDATNAARRGEYLRASGQLLQTHMESLVGEWSTAGSNYRASFEGETVGEQVRRALTGMIILSGFETGGERLQAALDAGDQEEEHSCFSDNTHNDMIFDLVGVENVWLGRYRRNDGSTVQGGGMRQLVQEFDPDLADELTTRIRTSVELAEALQPPFDQEIQSGNTDGNQRVRDLIASCTDQETLLSRVFTGLGFTVPSAE